MRETHCAACGAQENLHFHHLTPKSLGGSDDETNLITLCGDCHAKAHGVRAKWKTSELVRQSLARKKAIGERTGSLAYGYRLAEDGKTLVPVPKEQQAIRHADRIVSSGVSLRKTASQLASMGFHARNGEVFEPTQIQRMVNSARSKPSVTALERKP